jgi:hypothetical protein
VESEGERHLSPDELDAVMRLQYGPPAAEPGVKELSEAQGHLAACEICRSMAAMRCGAQVERFPECPQESQWPRLAARLTKGKEAERLLQHAATCDHCGPLLRQSTQDFSEDLTAEEEATLTQLQSSQAGWQERLAAKLREPPRSRSIGARLRELLSPSVRIPAWSYAVGFVLVAALSFGGLFYSRPRPIDELLASAYTEKRTIELRIPKAAYGRFTMIRGSTNRSRLDRPLALLEVEARIARELEKDPANPALLQAMGRADLLDWNYGAAIASLERALKAQPDSPSLKIDLASAYVERAEALHQASGYDAAAELLSNALKAAPDDPVAVFNRAIVYERMRLYDKAIQDWQRYLRVASDSSWTSEAKKRLADVEQSKKSIQIP